MTTVFLPGMDGTATLFPSLPAGAVSLALPPVPMSYADLADWFWPLIPEGPWTLVAESFSGPLAVQVAAANPPGLERLVLVASFVTPPTPALSDMLLRLAFALPPPHWVLRRLLLDRQCTEELVSAVASAIRSVPPEVMADRARRVMTVDARSALAMIRVPITYLRARQDRIVNASALDGILAIQPKTQVVTLDGPHLLLQTRWDEARRYILPS